jgi:hypothetical protein
MTPTEVLIAARKLCEEKWGQGPRIPDGCFCVYTSTGFVRSSGSNRAMWEADRILRKAIGVTATNELFAWNDHPSRTLADVLAAFDRAIELSKETT